MRRRQQAAEAARLDPRVPPGSLSSAGAAAEVAPLVELVADPRSMLTSNGTLRLTEEQARAILELRLNRLTGLGRDELGNEAKTLAGEIEDLLDTALLDDFNIDRREWTALAADRAAWRETLRLGHPPGYVEVPPTPPIARSQACRPRPSSPPPQIASKVVWERSRPLGDTSKKPKIVHCES